MNRRIILIVGAAILFALLVGLVWFWFFRGGGAQEAGPGGSFGAGQERTGGAPGSAGQGGNTGSATQPGRTGTTGSTNIAVGGSGSAGGVGTAGGAGQTGVGGAGGIGGIDGTGGVGTVGGVDGVGGVGTLDALSAGATGGIAVVPGVGAVPGVDWVGGGTGGGPVGGGATTNFIPSTVNQISDGFVGGSPTIQPTLPTAEQGGGSALLGLGGIFGAGAGCALLFATAEGPANADAAARAGASALGGFVLTYDFNAYKQRSQTQFKNVSDCLARTIAKAVLQQMTSSIVNWINSGFNGKPSFVTNYQQFFNNVGDQAAGEFIRGTGLSFLCSPFQLQIKVAIAQSYARRNAPSCSLTGIIRNVTAFTNGSFSQGGWKGLLQFTTIPTNNPYGAYAYAQAGLQTAQQQAVSNARNNLSPGGFISVQKCDPPGSKNCKVVTPGSVIEDSLKTTLEQPYLANQLAKSFDEIIGAMMNQLMVKTLYNGLSNISGQSGYASSYLTPAQQQAQTDAQNLLIELQGRVQIAQQYGAVQQGMIADIQNTQSRLQGLANCWEIASSSPTLTAAQTAAARASALSTLGIIQGYEADIARYNLNIERANQGIVRLQEIQTLVVGAATPQDVAAGQAAYSAAASSGALVASADVTNAQQNRASLQSTLASRNQQTAAELQQCNAL